MPEPTKIPRPFADSGDKNSIPDSSGSIGFASWQEGFPAITSEPFAQGGVAPKRADFNGVFNALSAATVWNQQGGVYAYDATTDYEVGNIIEYSGDLYKCITANGPSSAVKAPTDTTVWDAIATASGYLPLSGGTMTGSIKTSAGLALGRTNNASQLTLVGGGDTAAASGAKCVLNGANYTNSGWFNLQAGNSGGYKQLIGKPDGTLTWDGKDIPVIEAGTFTPILLGSTVTGAFTYTTQTGNYLKIGSLCFVDLSIGAKVVTVPTGYAQIDGFPFYASSAAQSLLLNITNSSPSGLDNAPFMCRLSSSGSATIWGIDTTSNNTKASRFASGLAVDTQLSFRFSGAYRTA